MKKLESIDKPFEGIIVGIPKTIDYVELYLFGRNSDGSISMISYNHKNNAKNTLCPNRVTFNLNILKDELTLVQFDTLEEFCRWYIQQRGQNNYKQASKIQKEISEAVRK